MFRFLLVLFLIGFVLTYLLGFSVFRSFRSFFSSDDDKNRKRTSSSRSSRPQQNGATKQKKHKKVINEDEGEYVDYEEVK
ncbi:MAG: DUF4834 family protein [Tannerella sp.]|jgi:hypothetical protein|nr:DUF4834 family protein [Tannerella sp.]